MSFGIDQKKLKRLVDLYSPHNEGQQMQFMLSLQGEQQLYMSNSYQNPFQGITINSIEQRISWFGKNQVVESNPITFVKMLIAPLDYFQIKVLILCTLLQFVVSYFINYSQFQLAQLESIISLVVLLVNYAILLIIQYDRYIVINRIAAPEIDVEVYKVIRENKFVQIHKKDVVVGDIFELKQGQILPADGWLIEGQVTVEQTTGGITEILFKDTMVGCVVEFEKSVNEGRSQTHISQRSPVLISGSVVINGEGKMIVLCVGKMSRVGQFITRTLNGNTLFNSVLEEKTKELTFQIIVICTSTIAFFFLIYLARILIQNSLYSTWTWPSFQQGLVNLFIGLLSLQVALPQGFLLGLGLSCLYYQRMLIYQDIRLRRASDCCNLSIVSTICYDKREQPDRAKYKQWWNESSQTFNQTNSDVIFTQPDQLQLKEAINRSFYDIMKYSFVINNARQPNQTYSTSRKSSVKIGNNIQVTIFEQSIDDDDERVKVSYFCNGTVIKYISMNRTNEFINLKNICVIPEYEYQQNLISYLFIKGQGQQIIDLCSRTLSKTTGKCTVLDEDGKKIIRHVCESMTRRFIKPAAVAYKPITSNLHTNNLSSVQSGNFIFLYLIGICLTRQDTEYQIIRRLRDVGINSILCSQDNFSDAINKAKRIGITTADDNSLALDGNEFLHTVGGIICSLCKKTICACSEGPSQLRLRKEDEFTRIIKHLRVVSSVHYDQKLALVLGLENSNRHCAVVGQSLEDIPAIRSANVSITVVDGKETSELISNICTAQFSSNSLTQIYRAICWSRTSCAMLRKFVQLSLTASLVGTSMLLLSLLLFKQYAFKVGHCLWVNFIICPLLGLNLAMERLNEDIMNQKQQNYYRSKPFFTMQLLQPVLFQAFFQVLVLLCVMLTGHLYIEQHPDSIDLLIGNNWQAKYSNTNKNRIASGLYYDLFTDSSLYVDLFVRYGIPSRHMLIVFNLFALMQMFNYFNCRKLRPDQINIFAGIRIINVTIFVAIVALQAAFITFGGSNFAFYPNGLSIQHWAFCAGTGMVVWVVGFAIKLVPVRQQQTDLNTLKWTNKAYNLSIKSQANRSQLLDFQIEEYQTNHRP